MTAHPSKTAIPDSLLALRRRLAQLHEDAFCVVEAWDLDDEHRGRSLEYHMGRRDAYDVVLWLVAEMLRLEGTKRT